MYVCMYVFMYVIYVCMYASACVYMCMYLCIHECMYACMYRLCMYVLSHLTAIKLHSSYSGEPVFDSRPGTKYPEVHQTLLISSHLIRE
jgi:hypothetical protein